MCVCVFPYRAHYFRIFHFNSRHYSFASATD